MFLQSLVQVELNQNLKFSDEFKQINTFMLGDFFDFFMMLNLIR